MSSLKNILAEKAVNVSYTGSIGSENVKEALDSLKSANNDVTNTTRRVFWDCVIPRFHNSAWEQVLKHQVPFAHGGSFGAQFGDFYFSVNELQVPDSDVKDLRFSTWLELYNYVINTAEIVADQFISAIHISCYAYVDMSKKISKIYGMNTFYSTIKGRKNYKSSQVKTASQCNWDNLGTMMEDIYSSLLGFSNGLNTSYARRTLWFPQNYKKMYALRKDYTGDIQFETGVTGDRMYFNTTEETWQPVVPGQTFNIKNSVIYGLSMSDGDPVWTSFGTYIKDEDYILRNSSFIRIYLLESTEGFAFYIKPMGQDIFRLGYADKCLTSDLYVEIEGRDSYKQTRLLTSLNSNFNNDRISLAGNGYAWVITKTDIFSFFSFSSTYQNQTNNLQRRTIKFFYKYKDGYVSDVSKALIATSQHNGTKVKVLLDYND